MTTFLKAAEIGTGGLSTLPGRFYTSQDIFRQEQQRIFSERWICAGREEQIAEPGDYFVRNISAESVILTRDRAGEVRAFHNVCRHRGTRLCEEVTGHFKSNIVCPYHAWTYALDGRLLGASWMDGLEGFDVADYPLHAVPLALWEGFIFICLSDEPEPFDESHAPILTRFRRFNLPGLRSMRRIDYDVKANWKLVLENYNECYHCGPVHPALVKLSPANSGANDLTSGPFLGGYMVMSTGNDSMSMSGRNCAIPVAELPEEDLRRVYYYTIFPNMLLSLHPDYVMVHKIWPQSTDRTLIECEWLFHPDAASYPGFDPDDGVAFWDKTNREDWHICEQSHLGVVSNAYTPGPFSPQEAISAAFDMEYRRALGPV